MNYKLRDWLFSRQRYWGEPFPIVHLDDGTVVALSEDDLPIELPPIDEFKPTASGEPPLARANAEWLEVTLPDGRKGRRETNTMPQWAGSCWYYLRYLDAQNSEAAWSKEAENYWMPVDLYVGGVEHAVLHLLYARFWHKVLFDCGLVSTKEPFQKLFNQGMILAHSFREEGGKYHSPEAVEQRDKDWFVKGTDMPVATQIEKMSKSRLNVVNPDDVIEKYGADALRLYELFMGPLDQVKPWQTAGVDGVYRFLARAWRLVVDEETGTLSAAVNDDVPESNKDLQQSLHRAIKKVGEDTLAMRFNTAIAAMMAFVNDATGQKTRPRAILFDFLRILAPYAPHVAEELHERLGGEGCLAQADWPTHDEALCVDDTITLGVQVNGKRRDEVTVARDASKEECEKATLALEKIQRLLDGKEPRKIIVVPGRLVNIVV